MGNILCGLKDYIFPRKTVKMLMIGLDAAGKTTILYKMKLGEIVTTIPTIGFNIETVTHQNVDFVIWDVGSRDKIRPLWRHYFKGLDAIVFVIDSNDHERFDEAKDELWRVIKSSDLPPSTVVLVVANKQDLSSSLKSEEITKRLDLDSVSSGRPWYICSTSAITADDQGFHDGLDWVHLQLTGKFVKEFVNKPLEEVKGSLISSYNDDQNF